jgi:hypothetical protein
MSIISCSSSIRSISTNTPCLFYPEKLEVIGSDLDYNDSIYVPSNQIFSSIYLLHNDHSKEFRGHIQEKYLFDETTFKISHCRDTSWAKEQILNEIYRKWNVKEIDTLEYQKYYYIYLVDSTKYPKIITEIHPGNYHTKLMDGFVIHSYVDFYWYVGVIRNALSKAYGHENVRIYTDDKTTENIIPGYFHMMLSKDIGMYNCPIEEIKKYARDSMGLDFILTQEKFVPVKIIRF